MVKWSDYTSWDRSKNVFWGQSKNATSILDNYMIQENLRFDPPFMDTHIFWSLKLNLWVMTIDADGENILG